MISLQHESDLDADFTVMKGDNKKWEQRGSIRYSSYIYPAICEKSKPNNLQQQNAKSFSCNIRDVNAIINVHVMYSFSPILPKVSLDVENITGI